MADIYSLEKGKGSRKLVTSHDSATSIKFGGTQGVGLALCQASNLQYNQRTEPRFEVGDDKIFWACGQSQGTLTVNKLVGADDTGASGVWEGMKGFFGQGRGNAKVTFHMNTPNGNVVGDGVFQQAALSFTVGDMAISDNAVMAVGFVEPKAGGGANPGGAGFNVT